MPSVSGSDGSYNYYQKQLNDLSDDNAAERKKAKEREEERLAKLERNHARELREQEETSDRALERAKNDSAETLHNERQNARADLERFKHDTYDRFGRINQDMGAEFRSQMEDLQDNLDAEKKQHKHDLRHAEATYDSKLSDQERRANAETARAVEKTRNDLDASHQSSVNAERTQEALAAEKGEARYHNLDKSRLHELQDQKRRYESALDEANENYNRRLDLAKDAYEKSTERQDRALRDTETNEADRLRRSHERETRDLRDQMGNLIEAEKDYVKEGAKGRAAAIGEVENEANDRLSNQQHSYEREINDLRGQNDRTARAFSARNAQNLRDRDSYYARALQKENADHHNQERDMLASFQRDRNQSEILAKRDHDRQEKTFENRLAEANLTSSEAMQKQAQALGESAENQHQSDLFRIKRLQDALNEHQTSADTSLISPAAEAAVRRQISDHYQKISDADQARRLRENEQIRGDYHDKLVEETQRHHQLEASNSRRIASERHSDEEVFNSHVADLEYMKESALRRKDEDAEHQRQMLTKNYARMLDRQSRQTAESMDVAKTEASDQLASMRQEFQFKQKMAQREFSNKISETIRQYDKKMDDQKSEYEARIADLKTENANQKREAEHNLKKMLENQQRNYDQKLAQQEAQFKERERYMKNSFEDQLDKIKKANAMLIQRRDLG